MDWITRKEIFERPVHRAKADDAESLNAINRSRSTVADQKGGCSDLTALKEELANLKQRVVERSGVLRTLKREYLRSLGSLPKPAPVSRRISRSAMKEDMHLQELNVVREDMHELIELTEKENELKKSLEDLNRAGFEHLLKTTY